MKAMTLTMDDVRHRKLKETAQVTGLSMSEVVRLALDKLWKELGDLKNPNRDVLMDLYANKVSPLEEEENKKAK